MKKRTKNMLTAVAIVLVLCAMTGGTAAYLNGAFGLTNTFTQGTVTPAVVETFDGTVKTDVAVHNNGNVPIYARCRVSIYKEAPDGSISGEIPVVGTDYTIAYPANLDANWIRINDIYYYKKPIQPGERTQNLIDRCELKQAGIVVDISVQSIQANPAIAVQEAWKVVEADENGLLRQAAAADAP